MTATLDTNQRAIELLKTYGGFYECPKDAGGNRLGPLVACTARYDGVNHWVSDIYADFARIECYGRALKTVAELLFRKMPDADFTDGFCGVPEGGKALAAALAIHTNSRYIYPEKVVKVPKTPLSREISEFLFGRHEPFAGESYWIVEDVCNNFSTTKQLVELIEKCGASVAGILCFLNRSMDVGDVYNVRSGLALPVISLARIPILEYRQDDPAVRDDVRRGNIARNPKGEMSMLVRAMARHGG